MNSKNVTPVGTGKTTNSNEGKQQLSSGLKERLKRCGRYHCTPPSAKRPCLSSQRELTTHILNESPTVNADKPINSKWETVGLGNDTTPKPLKSCSRKVNTSLSFLSPILKPVINNIKGVSSNADSSNSPLLEAPVCSESLSDSTLLFQSSKPVVNNCKKAAPSNFSPSSPLPDTRVSSESLSASPLPDVGETGTPLSSKLSQGGRRICVRNKNKLFDGDCDGSGGNELIHLRKELRDLESSLAIKEEKLRKLKMVKMYRSKNNLEELQRLIDKWRSVSQDSITDLHQLLPEPRPSLRDFLDHLQVDKDLVQIQLEEDD